MDNTTIHDRLLGELTSIGFARVCRHISETLGEQYGIYNVAYRSPGRIGQSRAIRRSSDGVTIAVRYRNRPAVSVVGDIIEGSRQASPLIVNDAEARDKMWAAAMEALKHGQ